jgi:hypothetical protein
MKNNGELQQINPMPRIGNIALDLEAAAAKHHIQRAIYISTY